MGRHSKCPTKSHTGPWMAVALATSGAFSAVPLTQGTAVADEAPSPGWDSVRDAIAKCESNFNLRAANPESTASGKYQLLDSTWRTVGGLLFGRRARDATAEEQEITAERLYNQSGTTPWNSSRSCWRRWLGKMVPGARSTVGRHHAMPAPLAQRVRYTIRSGDTLSQIAVAHGHTWQDLFAQNRAALRDPNLIPVGLVINL